MNTEHLLMIWASFNVTAFALFGTIFAVYGQNRVSRALGLFWLAVAVLNVASLIYILNH